MDFEQIKIVLVRPKYSRNIGAVCRAMKTMNLHHLWIVGNADFDRAEAERTALHATDVLEQAQLFDSLETALKDGRNPDIHLIVGTTRRKGKRRKFFSLSPEELADRISTIETGQIAILFGNEETGLTDEELDLCQLAVNIPTAPAFPSLNLSHAVQIITYQLFRKLSALQFPLYTPIDNQKMNQLISVILASLKDVGFFKQIPPDDMEHFFKDIFTRATLSGREAKQLEKIFSKIRGLIMKEVETAQSKEE
jgi:tRNA/rRNA methyltransferase